MDLTFADHLFILNVSLIKPFKLRPSFERLSNGWKWMSSIKGFPFKMFSQNFDVSIESLDRTGSTFARTVFWRDVVTESNSGLEIVKEHPSWAGVQVVLVICGLFICEFTVHQIYWNSVFADITLLIRNLKKSGFDFILKMGSLKMIIFIHIVLPHYSQFHYLQYFDGTYLPRITRAACIRLEWVEVKYP